MIKNSQKIFDIIKELSTNLSPVCPSGQAAQQEAWWLLEKATGKPKATLLGAPDQVLSREQHEQLACWVVERVFQRKPLQYILGSVPFCGLEILVEPPMLIPRPETEEWVTWLIGQLQPVKDHELRILDLCTGTGCIALALARALPKSTIVGSDISQKALALAEKNKNHNRLTNLTFVQADVYQGLDQSIKYDLIVSNPPYITLHEYETLQPEVKQWEDIGALVAAQNGLEFYARIVKDVLSYLNNKSILYENSAPQVIIELGTQIAPIEKLFFDIGFSKCTVYNDLQGVERWLAAVI